MAYSLADGSTDENDVRDGEDGLPPKEVAQHTGDQATEERAQRSCRRDELLHYLSAACRKDDYFSTYLLARRQFCRPQVPSNCYERPRYDPSIVTYIP